MLAPHAPPAPTPLDRVRGGLSVQLALSVPFPKQIVIDHPFAEQPKLADRLAEQRLGITRKTDERGATTGVAAADATGERMVIGVNWCVDARPIGDDAVVAATAVNVSDAIEDLGRLILSRTALSESRLADDRLPLAELAPSA